MNSIEFVRYPRRDDPNDPTIGIRIDGTDLRLLIAEVTRPLWYQELYDEDFDSEAEKDQFVRDSHDGISAIEFSGLESPAGLNGMVPLLGCPCGLWFCWPLLARVEFTDRTITWSDFHNPCRTEWDLSVVGPFAFDAEAYRASLASPVALDADTFGHGDM